MTYRLPPNGINVLACSSGALREPAARMLAGGPIDARLVERVRDEAARIEGDTLAATGDHPGVGAPTGAPGLGRVVEEQRRLDRR